MGSVRRENLGKDVIDCVIFLLRVWLDCGLYVNVVMSPWIAVGYLMN